MLHIDIWADFARPACYLAKPRIDQAIAACGHADAITVTRRSLELFPDAIHHPVASSFDAHRMLHLAAGHGTASELMDAVQRDLLDEGVNVYTAAYLANAATRAGVPAARVTQALTTGDPQ